MTVWWDRGLYEPKESSRGGSLASGWHSRMGSGVGTQLIFSICLSFFCVIPVWAEGKMRSPDQRRRRDECCVPHRGRLVGRVLWFVCNVALKSLLQQHIHILALSQNQTLRLFNDVGTLVLTQCFITLIALTLCVSASLSLKSLHITSSECSLLCLLLFSVTPLSLFPLSLLPCNLSPCFCFPLEQW